ncbi:MAG: ABC transporter ATP-binding protein [Elusimicrobia bacterium]|nr:ABC transporter ATP-binding protein [Elusimicrobiota bacterium]
MPDTEYVLRIKDLRVEYRVREGFVKSVDDIDLDIEKGKFTAIIGESGCGKSTLNNVIMDILSPNAVIGKNSRVFFNGEDLLKLDRERLRQFRWRKAAMVFQAAQNALNPLLKVSEQFLDVIEDHETGEKKRESLQRINKLLELVKLDSRRVLSSYPHELSGGMRQRTIIALALVLDPEFLILDEPTTALDIITQSYIFDILTDIHNRLGLTMALVTHDISAAARLADNVVVMYAGKIMETGDIHSIFNSSRHPYSRGLLNAMPSIEGETVKKKPIPGSPPDLLNKPPGCVFHPRCGLAGEICAKEEPGLEDTGGGHKTACHKWREALP